MILWFSSQKGAITLAAIGLLTFVAYSFLVSRYILEELTPGIGAALLETIIVIAIVGGWTWGLLSASENNQSGWIVLLVCSLLPTLFTIYDLSFYSPIPQGWPLLQAVVWITFFSCALASISIIIQLRKL
jgi:hypothetical protein